ncbi:MAG: purine-nucleoside phosphorylase [Clostridiales bacterium]|jgi:purine-nucleoside phosphorylase|nr:purine-nucleoside phosphorylase [Clostridiales bacterium]
MNITESPSTSIKAPEGSIAKVVLMPGDPLRAKFVAENYLEDAECFNSVRNMLGYTGTYKGKRVSAMGSGMGVPSMVLYAQELYSFFGVEAIIRIGSAGGIGENVSLRDVIVAMTASTNSNIVVSADFPGIIAPCADYNMLRLAVAAAEKNNVPVKVGSVFTSDYFYNPLPEANARLRKLGLLAVEMETAGLYVTAARLGKKALSVLTISDHVFTGEGLSAQERQDSFREMMEIALETAWGTI